jgi:hypothetical protein
MMEHGMFPQLWEMIASRAKAVQGMTDALEKTDLYTMRKSTWEAWLKQNDKAAPLQKMSMFEQLMGASTPEEQQWNRMYWSTHPASGDQKADYDNWLAEFKKYKEAASPYRFSTTTIGATELSRRMDEYTKQYIEAGVPEDQARRMAFDKANGEINASKSPGSALTAIRAKSFRDNLADVKNEHPDWTDAQQENEAARRLTAASASPATQRKEQTYTENLKEVQAEHPDWSAAQQMNEAGRRTVAATTASGQSLNAQTGNAVRAKLEELRAQHKGDPAWTESRLQEEAIRSVRLATTVITGNKADDLKKMVDRIKYADQTMDNAISLMKKHKAITGLGGELTRPFEVMSNWFGSNETDRKEFERLINDLQMWASQIMLESNTRPLSSQEHRILKIIPGMSPGDTTQNTVRAFRELKQLFAQMQGDLVKRLGGTWEPPAAGDQPKDAGDKPMWMQGAPVH